MNRSVTLDCFTRSNPKIHLDANLRISYFSSRLSQDGLVIEDEMSLDAGIVSASFDTSLEMVNKL